jgi:hypothetical protein
MLHQLLLWILLGLAAPWGGIVRHSLLLTVAAPLISAIRLDASKISGSDPNSHGGDADITVATVQVPVCQFCSTMEPATAQLSDHFQHFHPVCKISRLLRTR